MRDCSLTPMPLRLVAATHVENRVKPHAVVPHEIQLANGLPGLVVFVFLQSLLHSAEIHGIFDNLRVRLTTVRGAEG